MVFVSVHACAGQTHVCVCVHACMCVRDTETLHACVCVCVLASGCDVGPPAVTPRSAPFCLKTKGRLFPPISNRGLLRQRWPCAAELTKYFPSCSEFVSINSVALCRLLSPRARCL